jgi:hypothetical protein
MIDKREVFIFFEALMFTKIIASIHSSAVLKGKADSQLQDGFYLKARWVIPNSEPGEIRRKIVYFKNELAISYMQPPGTR